MTTTQIQRVERDDVLSYVVEIFKEIAADWDVGEIVAETQVSSLGLESIAEVYLIAEIQQRYHLQGLLFDKLRETDVRISELCVADIVDLVCQIEASPDVESEYQSI